MLPQPILVSDEKIVCGDMLLSKNYSFFRSEYQSRLPEYNNDNQVRKIIAGIEGLPKLDLSAIAEEIGLIDVEKLAKEYSGMRSAQSSSVDTSLHNARVAAFREGFKAAQSLNEKKYSEEDMIEFCQFHRDYFTQCSTEMWNTVPTVSESFKVWLSKRKPKEYQVEVEMERVRYPKGDDGWEDVYTPKITNNTIKVTKIL